MTLTLAAGFSAQFTLIDWLIVAAYLVFTTWLGVRMAGKQANMRDFFLGGRKLPWYAVSASIIATEISAVTFVIVPFIVFKPGGNFTYLQLGIFGSLFARIIVGYVLVPAYYQREIYSPYDYMGHRLGGRVRGMTTALFALSGILAQSGRVYLTAEILNVVMHDQLVWLTQNTHIGLYPLGWAILFITIVAVGWTLIGGIATVIWTDAILFLVFLIGAVAALITIGVELPGGFGEMFRMGWAATDSGSWGKFSFFDFSLSPIRSYTIWTAVIATTWGGMGAYGTDQLLAQRMFCCKNQRDARRAIIASAASQLVTITVALVGVGLYAYYKQNPTEEILAAAAGIERHADYPLLAGEALELYEKKGDRIFPIFVVQAIPVGLKGLIIAGIFAAAVSSLTSILAALSQTFMTAFYNPLRERWLRARGVALSIEGDAAMHAATGETTAEDRHSVMVSRLLVLFWGIGLAAMAFLAKVISDEYPSILDMVLAMASYAAGALLAGFALAFLPLKVDGRGFMYSGPLSVLCIFALVWHQPWTHGVCWGFGALLLAIWIWNLITQATTLGVRDWLRTVILMAGVAFMLWLNYFGYWKGEPDADGNPAYIVVAWPWYTPIGSMVAFAWGYLLARRRTEAASA